MAGVGPRETAVIGTGEARGSKAGHAGAGETSEPISRERPTCPQPHDQSKDSRRDRWTRPDVCDLDDVQPQLLLLLRSGGGGEHWDRDIGTLDSFHPESDLSYPQGVRWDEMVTPSCPIPSLLLQLPGCFIPSSSLSLALALQSHPDPFQQLHPSPPPCPPLPYFALYFLFKSFPLGPCLEAQPPISNDPNLGPLYF